jgi:putative ribosome biogenesis GTPase RsgA
LRNQPAAHLVALKPDNGIPNLMPLVVLLEMKVAKLVTTLIGAAMLFGQLGVGLSTVLNQLSEESVSSRGNIPSP